MATLVTAPATEPVALSLVKSYARIETGSEEDTLLNLLITSCRQEVETYCQLCLIEQEWEDTLDSWPVTTAGEAKPVWAPRLPVIAAAVSLADPAGGAPTSFTTLSLRKDTGRLLPLDSAPYTTVKVDGVTILWTLGYPVDGIPQQLITALLDLITYRYEHRGQDEARDGTTTGIPDVLKPQLDPFRVRKV